MEAQARGHSEYAGEEPGRAILGGRRMRRQFSSRVGWANRAFRNTRLGIKFSPPRRRRIPTLPNLAKGGHPQARKLFENDLTELAGQVITWARRKEQRITRPIRSRAAAEIDGPELVNVDYRAGRVLDCSYERAG